MIPTFLNTTFSGLYAGGISYFLQATALDQKVFDFAAPHFKHAFAFGAVYSLSNLTLEAIIRDLTHTTFTTESMMYAGTYTEMHSANPAVYKIGHVLAKVISAFGSVYLVRQMNYSISYRFAAICMLPSLIISVAKVNQE
jgi:hypothetical protein